MTNWPCHVWLQKKIVWPTNKGALGGGVTNFYMYQFGWWDIVYLSPNHNIHGENGVYQWWTTYADLINSKKTQSFGKKCCRQKCLKPHKNIFSCAVRKVNKLLCISRLNRTCINFDDIIIYFLPYDFGMIHIQVKILHFYIITRSYFYQVSLLWEKGLIF